MIYLTCGLPGAGKTLLTLSKVKELAEKDSRPVFYSRIANVKLPGWTELEEASAWTKCPPQSIIVLDECQHDLPANTRGKGSKVPEWIQEFSTHRHKGVDIFLITQDPMQFDHFVRRLVQVYWQVVRPFGMQYATVWQFESVQAFNPKEAAAGFYDKISTKFRFDYPKDLFEVYKSAEVHTHKRRLPWKKLAGVAALLLGVVVLSVVAYRVVTGMRNHAVEASPKKDASPDAGISASLMGQGSKRVPATRAEYIAARTVRFPAMPESAPIYDELAKPVAFPRVAGCVAQPLQIVDGERVSKGCTCYSQQGTVLTGIDMPMCLSFVAHGAFDPYIADRGGPSPADKSSQPKVAAVGPRADPVPGKSVLGSGPVERVPVEALGDAYGMVSASSQLPPDAKKRAGATGGEGSRAP